MRKEALLMKLSIIIPYYNSLTRTKILLSILEKQLTKDVEIIVVDDGCHESELDKFNVTVIHLPENSGCAGIPRNHGLELARGEYITFIDSDDFVSDDFVEKILNKIETSDFDYCLMSWKSIVNNTIIDVKDGRPEWNCSVWGIVYKKELIGDVRFNNERIAEDYTFNQQVLKGKEEKITDVMYFYDFNENGISASWEGDK
jgi:glycosyltransferase involved in cell wall biosynthesis